MKGAYLSPSVAVGAVDVWSQLQFCLSVHMSHVFPHVTVKSGFWAPKIPLIIYFVIPTHEGKDKGKFSDLPKTA